MEPEKVLLSHVKHHLAHATMRPQWTLFDGTLKKTKLCQLQNGMKIGSTTTTFGQPKPHWMDRTKSKKPSIEHGWKMTSHGLDALGENKKPRHATCSPRKDFLEAPSKDVHQEPGQSVHWHFLCLNGPASKNTTCRVSWIITESLEACYSKYCGWRSKKLIRIKKYIALGDQKIISCDQKIVITCSVRRSALWT